jgi:hypothetical protein
MRVLIGDRTVDAEPALAVSFWALVEAIGSDSDGADTVT